MYRIIAKLPASYTFAGNARQATFGISADASLETHVLSFASADAVKFINGNVTIKRARLIASGAECLNPGKEKIAAKMHLKFVNGTNSSPVFTMSFAKWNEWTEQNLSVGTGEIGGPCELAIVESGTEFTCDDYSIADDFVGQTVVPMVEMEVECVGISPVE